MERPAKRVRMLSDDSASESGDQADVSSAIKVNDEYAKRFQHNKAREERQRLDEKYGSVAALESDEDSESETEDDEGELVTKELDYEIFATLNAIKTKDPRVYNKEVNFYTPIEQDVATNGEARKTKEKAMNLQDYHRKNLLYAGPDNAAEDFELMSYNDEQSAIKRDLMDQVHKLDKDDAVEGSELDETEFLVKKPGQKPQVVRLPEIDVAVADKDPETYLSNFMAARAWVPPVSSTSQFQPFESEDEDEEDRADAFEQAYNLRFEDPKFANEKLMSHSRDLAAKYSVRREDATGRKRVRDLEKAKKDAEKREREEDRARYRRLKIEEAQEKLQKFKEAAGLRREAVPIEEWSKFLNAGWDSEKWDREMANRFGDSYYEVKDEEEDDAALLEERRGKKKSIRRPKWNDDIDIDDLVPDFDEEEERAKGALVLSDGEDANSDGGVPLSLADQVVAPTASKTSKSRAKTAEKERMETKRQARKERQKIEELVDQSLGTDLAMAKPSSSRMVNQFRYRETSPSTFGLSAREILMADDSQLNQFVGLKKLAAFRDDEKKRKDKKKMGKKARLRQWRKETFGDEEGPKTTFEDYINSHRAGSSFLRTATSKTQAESDGSGVVMEKKKKKRSRKRKAAEASP